MAGYAESWLKIEESLGGTRPVLSGSAEEMRAQLAGLLGAVAPLYPPPSEDILTEDGRVDGIAYRKYTPRQSKDQVTQVAVFFHAGGFVVGGLDSEDAFCRVVALLNDIMVVSVDYRLAPEHKLPTQLEDSLKVLEWAYENAIGGSQKPTELFVIGASAGGALSLAVTRKVTKGLTALPKNGIKGVAVLCPVTLHPDHVPAQHQNLYTSYEERKENVPMIDKQTMMQFFKISEANPSDEDIFPLLDEASLSSFPPTYVATADMDPLRDDGKVLVKVLTSSGVQVQANHYQGVPHCFWIFPTLPETSIFIQDVQKAVSWLKASK